MDFTLIWAEREKDINRRLQNIQKQKNNFDTRVVLEQKEYFDEACEHLTFVSKIFNMTEAKVKSMLSYNSYILHCSEEELVEKFEYFKNIFGDSLLDVIKYDNIDMPAHYNGIFSYKNKEIILEKINGLKKVFNIEIDGIVRLLSYSSRYLYMSKDTIVNCMTDMQNYFAVSYNEIVNMFILYPKTIDVSVGLLKSRCERLCDFFSCDIEKIKEMYMSYPKSMHFTPSEINNALRFKLNRTRSIKNEILEAPWIIDCISRVDNHEYCGFSSLANLIEIAKYIKNQFGKVIYVIKKNWDKRNVDITYLLTKKNKMYYLLNLGAKTLVERYLDGIFGKSYSRIDFQIVKEDIFNLDDYFVQAYLGFVGGQEGVLLKNETCIVEYPPTLFTESLYKGIKINLDNEDEVSFNHILRLDKGLASKHKEYFEIKKSQREEKAKQREKECQEKFLYEDDFEIDDIDFDDLFEDNEIKEEIRTNETINDKEEKDETTIDVNLKNYARFVFDSEEKMEQYILSLKNQ